MSKRDLPSPEYLRQRLRYEPETGKLYWRVNPNALKGWNGKHAGTEAGHKQVCGRINVSVDRKVLKAHRVAWAMYYGEWPAGQIDHINHEASDNRIENLRDVDNSQNQRNLERRKVTISGVLGVRPAKGAGRWEAYIRVGGRHLHLGTFDTKAEAARVRQQASEEYGFHPNHGVCLR